MKTRSMKECVLMWKSRDNTKEANSIPLVETFLIHLGEHNRENKRHENEYLHKTAEKNIKEYTIAKI